VVSAVGARPAAPDSPPRPESLGERFKPSSPADDNYERGKRLSELLRDPRYVIPLIMLIVVIVISAAMGAGPNAVDSAVPSVPGIPREGEPSPTPDVSNDYRRAIDLGTLREAAQNFYRRNGLYPSTAGAVVALCIDALDVGCTLREARGLPSGDGEFPYHYASDGATYALFIARADTPGDIDACPASLPPALSDVPVMCARAEAGQ